MSEDKSPWISAYQPKEWSVYPLRLDSDEYEDLRKKLHGVNDGEVIVCGAESQRAAEYWDSRQSVSGMFYYDMEELLGMNLDKVYGGSLHVLTDEWNGHPKGSLVFTTYKGVNEEPRYFTIGIAAPSD